MGDDRTIYEQIQDAFIELYGLMKSRKDKSILRKFLNQVITYVENFEEANKQT